MDPQTTDLAQVPDQPVEVASGAQDLRQQIVSVINNSKNVLVTVGTNPSVDELSSALGLTFVLGKLGKHATAVFSGKVPPAMEFLDPENTFEDTVDSLRDFIIALDKEKADKLRYKVEDDVVKIFITPYKTVLTQKDLQFSQGDFNVDVVIALGATQSEELDKSITAHGRILHDATVVTINASPVKSNLGSIDWNDGRASSVSEMLVNLCDAFGSDLLDEQISTAFLTGIVAETNRFSNEKTSPKVMTMSAQLMAAGANQQLIATNLRQEGMLSEPIRSKNSQQSQGDGGEMVLEHTASSGTSGSPGSNNRNNENSNAGSKKLKNQKKKNANQQSNQNNGDAASNKTTNQVSEDSKPTIPENVVPSQSPDQTRPSEVDATQDEASQQPTSSTAAPLDVPMPTLPTADAPAEAPLPPLPEPVATPSNDLPSITPPPSRDAMSKPQFGGTLNSTQISTDDGTGDAVSGDDEQRTLEHKNDGVIPTNEEALEDARKALEAIPDPVQPPVSMGSLPMLDESLRTDGVESPAATVDEPVVSEPTVAPDPSPVDSFMQPHLQDAPSFGAFQPPVPLAAPFEQPQSTSLSTPQDDVSLPPLPPMPDTFNGAMPPLPPLPGQPTDTAANLVPQLTPEFIQTMPQSQNSWTQAGQDLAASQADSEAQRQAKIEERVADYEKTVDRNRELNAQSPLNNPSGSGLPPVPPTQPL